MYQVDDYKEIPVPYAVFELIYDREKKHVIDTRYVFVNARYCKMTHKEREQLLDQRFSSV